MSYEEYYTWQEDVPGFGKAAQEKLRNCTALVSRVGGLGGPLAFSLAAAGVGRARGQSTVGMCAPLTSQFCMYNSCFGSLWVGRGMRTIIGVLTVGRKTETTKT